ncbi:late blight resistance protein R1-A-like [Primulina tabacum]|uniref:late blight resistance protein R1-A-like n=1 Tax=Primulina tabacum TaxID=48773 RepID=UPI003F5A770D
MESLTGDQSNRKIVAIVGMGGIGKTALAKEVYDKPFIAHYFDLRAWATISQNHSAQEIISQILLGFGLSKQEIAQIRNELGVRLYKLLFGKRYLIVIDDLWSTEAWNKMHAFFPDNDNGIRIMITTRLLNVSRELNTLCTFEMELLSYHHSWVLLRDKVFGKESCPSELEELGMGIAQRCGGLPLAIVTISGLLAKSNKTRGVWKDVSENLSSVMNSDDANGQCQKILYLSYNNLPIHLKPCFLYMVTVPFDSEFSIADLTSMWIAEGILKPVRDKSLEEVANEYITDLADRNLIFLRQEPHGRECGMHDLLKDLCLKEAQKEKFVWVIGERNPDVPPNIESRCRRLCFGRPLKKFTQSGTQVINLFKPASLTRSVMVEFGGKISLASSSRLLRLLHVTDVQLYLKDEEVMQLVNLRILAIICVGLGKAWRLPSSISRFWSLQTLKIIDYSYEPMSLPSGIWDLPYLREICCTAVVLPDPPCSQNDKHNSPVLENLQTLNTIFNFRCTKEVLKRVPNLKDLRLVYEVLRQGVQWSDFCLHNLVYFDKLEILVLYSMCRVSLKYLTFPLSLKDLTLVGCYLPWDNMKIVGSLPNLEKLQLQDCAFEEKTWCPVEGEFVGLKLLNFAEIDLIFWRADKEHYPILEHLVLRNLNLKEVR